MRKVALYTSFVFTGVLSSYLTLVVALGSLTGKYFENFELATKHIENSIAAERNFQIVFYRLQLSLLADEVESVESGDMDRFYSITCTKLDTYIRQIQGIYGTEDIGDGYEESLILYSDLKRSGFCN